MMNAQPKVIIEHDQHEVGVCEAVSSKVLTPVLAETALQLGKLKRQSFLTKLLSQDSLRFFWSKEELANVVQQTIQG